LMHLCINGNEHDARYAESEIDRRAGDKSVQPGQILTAEGVEVLAAAGMAVANSGAALPLPSSPVPERSPSAIATERPETAEAAAKRKWMEQNEMKGDAPTTPAAAVFVPTAAAPAPASAASAAASGCVFDDLSDSQLMHLCLNGNEHDARYAESEIDRRAGDKSVQPGQILTAEGVEVLAAAGMPP
jgi:hypothetical protein